MKIPRGVCEELLEMERRDLEETERLAKSGELEKYGYHPALQKLHERNCGRLGEIWERYGMPTLQNGGEEAVLAAWRIAQHAIGSPAFMRRFAAECDKYSPEEIPLRGRAYLADRIAFYERRPQAFGTQFDYELNGRMRVWWLLDEERTEERRARAGLPPLTEAKKRFEEYPRISEEEAARKRAEQEAWLVETGWCTGEDIARYYRVRGKI